MSITSYFPIPSPPTFPIHHLLPPHTSPPTVPVYHLLPSPSFISYLPHPSPPTFPIHHLLHSPSITSYLLCPSPPTFPIHHLLPSPSFTSYLHHPIQMSLTFGYHSLWLVSVDCLLRLPRSPPEGCEVRLPCLSQVRMLPLSVIYIAGLKAQENASAHAEAPGSLISSPGP